MLGQWPKTSYGVVPRLVTVLGPVGSGKTELAIALAPMMAPKDRIFVVGHVDKVAVRLGVPFHRVDPYQRKAIQEFFARVESSPQHLLFVLDDADVYMSARAYDAPALFTLINTGRNFGKGGILIGHGSNSIPKNLLTNSHMVVFFRTTETNVLEYAQDYMGPNWPFGSTPAEKKADLDRVLRNLPDYQALLYTPIQNGGVMFPGFAKVVGGRVMVFPLTDRLDTNAEDTVDAEPVESSSPDDTNGAPDIGPTPTESPSGSPRRVEGPAPSSPGP